MFALSMKSFKVIAVLIRSRVRLKARNFNEKKRKIKTSSNPRRWIFLNLSATIGLSVSERMNDVNIC